MPETSLPVEFLFRVEFSLGSPASLIDGAPQGNRGIVSVTGGTFVGPRLKGEILTPGGDWFTRRSDGSSKLDVRATLRTDDGALILMTYNGIGASRDGKPWVRTAPLFETGDPRYSWLNQVQAVGLGGRISGGVAYDVYALL